MLARSRTLPSRIHHGAVEERHDFRHYLQVEVQPKTQAETEAINPVSNYSKCFDDDGRLKRTGTFWTATAHIITAVIGSGVLSLAWAIAQLGWVAGPAVLILFALVNIYTSNLLAHCYRAGDPGNKEIKLFHKSGGKDPCHMSSNGYMITFGIIEVLFSQIPDFDQVWWLSIVAAIMSFTYSSVGLGLGLGKVAVTATEKMWRSLQALGAIAFAYSFSIILIEIQHHCNYSFYLLCGCMGYASFGDLAPGNLLTGFGFYNPYWLLDIANVAIVVHLVGAYQVFCQPLFAFIEKWCAKKWPKSDFVTAEYDIPIPFFGIYQLNLFRLVWRTIFVIMTTLISMLLPFFNDVVGILGAFGFWPLTVFFPIEMYISQKKIAPWTSRWVGLQIISVTCLFISIAAAVGSFAGVVLDLKTYKPFKTSY
ncbi:amino acid permease 2 [Quercus suber]|uniref:Amino acid permease 2 n=1 Tax=Quercus suber TaxID=58331 RepID=A0AAW0MBV7_QUESU